MPTNRRRRMAGRRDQALSEEQRLQLLSGWQFGPDGGAYGRWERGQPFDDVAARRDWTDSREELLDFWLQDPAAWAKTNRPGFLSPPPGGPGTRPWAWWRFEGPGDRQVLGLAPIDDHAVRAMGARHALRAVLVESDAALLARHGLLEDWERERLPVSAFEPLARVDPEIAAQLEAEEDGL